MNANYSKLLTQILGILGVTGVSCLTILPAHAEEIRNAEYKNKTEIAQSVSNQRTNPRPSIFNEPPYNRGMKTPGVTPTENQETEKPPENPTTNTTTSEKNIVQIA
ncbi:MAG: hypothetical protein EAZ76_13225, partial [Nostocales cyanobacterium]